MDYSNKIARYEEIERRGLLDKLPLEKQEAWAEYKRRQQPKLELSDEQKAQIEANNKAYEEKYAKPFIESDIVRKPVALAQGVSNASLNPFGYIARSAGIDTKPLEAKDAVERALEKGGEYGYDAAALATVGNLAKGAGYLGKGNTVASKVAQEVLAPEVLMATGAGVGGGLVEGVTNPSTAFGSAVANIIGASVPASVGGALEKQIYNVKGGLENILSNNKGVQAVSRGIATDEAIANRVKEEAPVAMNNLNERMRNALNRLTGRKLDINQANVNQQNRYNEFIGKNADIELYGTKTAKQQAEENFNRWFEGSKVVDEKGKPLTLYHGTRANFDAFDINKAGQSNGNVSKIGFWLTPEKQIAKDFSESWYGGKNPKILSTYVNFKNPKIYKNVDNTQALKEVEGNIRDVKDNMQKIIKDYSYGNMNQLRSYINYDDFYDIAKMRGYTKEEADAALQYWKYDKQLDDLLFEQRVLQANDSYDQLMNDLDEYSKFIQHVDGVKDFKRGSHISDLAITNQDEAISKLKERLKKEGYDSIIVENTNRDTQNVGGNVSQYIAFEPNQIKSVNNSGGWSKSASLSDAGWMPKASLDNYTYDFNRFQKDALKQALDKGAYMSTNAKGTLGATHRGQEVLNDMIEASYDTSIIGQKKPTTETRQLMQVKERLNQILEPSGIKPYDASLSKAKALQDAYEKGYKFKPSETKFEALGLEKARDKRAFLQGRIASILDNVKDDKNIAKAIQADENTLRKLMPGGKYKQLLKDANNISTEYERVRGLANQAESKLVKKTPLGRPMSEKAETRGAIIGSILDRALSAINRRGDIRKASQYLNPETTQIVTREGVKGAVKKGSSAALRQLLIDRLEGE